MMGPAKLLGTFRAAEMVLCLHNVLSLSSWGQLNQVVTPFPQMHVWTVRAGLITQAEPTDTLLAVLVRS